MDAFLRFLQPLSHAFFPEPRPFLPQLLLFSFICICFLFLFCSIICKEISFPFFLFLLFKYTCLPFPPTTPHHPSPPPTLDPFLISVPLSSLQFLIPAPALTLVLFSYLYSQKNWLLLFGVPISSPLYKLAPSFPEASFPFHL